MAQPEYCTPVPDRNLPPVHYGYQNDALATELFHTLVPEEHEHRDLVWRAFCHVPAFKVDESRTLDEQRKQADQAMYYLRDHRLQWIPSQHDGYINIRKLEVAGEAMYANDPEQIVRMGVQWYLYGLVIDGLASPEQRRRWIPKANSIAHHGCFALTELGHGSNVRGIETTAEYDAASEAFVINTPTTTAQKYWIGGATTADHAVVFAQLRCGGKDRGVHAFHVQLRDMTTRQPLQGIRIADVGYKMGLNGVGNGRLWFSNVRVPRTSMLAGVAQVTRDGKYISKFKDNDTRFAASIAELVSGRAGMSVGLANMANKALTIAVRYGLQRRQFGEPGKAQEQTLMQYRLHRRRLIPLLARSYVLYTAVLAVRKMVYERSRDPLVRARQTKELHLVSCGTKAFSSWHALNSIQAAREACGGLGFKMDSKLGSMKNNVNAWVTFEGDNNVLLMQVGQQLLKDLAKRMGKHKVTSARLAYLDTTRSVKDLLADAMDDGDVSEDGRAGQIFRSHEFQHGMLCNREKRLLFTLGMNYQANVEDGMSQWDAWNAVVQHAIDAAQAHTDRWMYEKCHAFIQRLPAASSQSRKQLQRMLSLFSLWLFTNDRTFLALQLFPDRNVHAALCAVVDQLIDQLADVSLSLVNGFAFPDEALGPLANDYVSANTYEQAMRNTQYHGRACL